MIPTPMDSRNATCQCGNLSCEQKLPITYLQLEEIEAGYKKVDPGNDYYYVLPGHEANDTVIDRRDIGVLVVKAPPEKVAEEEVTNPPYPIEC
jgi:hypothetical protein